jgi:NAD(P)H-hydrate epimerase
VIQRINASERPVLAADVPSGMDCDTGRTLGACVRADATVTFVGLKPGFLELDAQKLLGEVVVADIGAPRELLERFGRRVAIPRRPDAPQREAIVESGPLRRRD